MFGDKPVIMFMECYGGKIQGGLYGGKERLIGFDVMVNGTYLDKLTIKEIFDKFGVETVEFFKIQGIDEALQIVASNPLSPHCEKGTTRQEGLVCVPTVRIYDHRGKRIIVKIKERDLLKVSED